MSEEDIVYHDTLDQRFTCKVIRTEPYRGTFTIEDKEEANKVIFTKDVGLAYDAKFGPDIGDVQDWQSMAVKYIDEEYFKIDK